MEPRPSPAPLAKKCSGSNWGDGSEVRRGDALSNVRVALRRSD